MAGPFILLVHGFEEVDEFFVDGGDCDALLLQSQRLKPLFDYLEFGLVLALWLHSNFHLVAVGVRVQLVESL